MSKIPFPSKMTILPSQNSLKKHVTIIFIFIYYLIFPFQSDAQLEHSDFFNQKQYGTPGKDVYGKPFMEAESLFHSGKFLAAKLVPSNGSTAISSS